MAERTPTADGEKAAEIAQDKKTVDIDGGVLSTETSAVAEDGGGIKRRAKRNIITVPEQSVVIERDGMKYRRDVNGQWRPILH